MKYPPLILILLAGCTTTPDTLKAKRQVIPVPAGMAKVCAHFPPMLEQIGEAWNEKPVFVGTTLESTAFMILVSETRSWTALIIEPRGWACVVSSGENWKAHERP